ncbi:hypothetical protein GC177_10310 [bacterium]|nr:hypothetical protein [bacterium]
MQLSLNSAAMTANSRYMAASHTRLDNGRETYQVTASSLDYSAVIVDIALEETPSPEAVAILHYTAQSTRLTGDDKRAIAKLAAIVDKFGGANHGKLMKDLAAVVRIMEQANPPRGQKSTGLARMLELYREERAKLGDDATHVRIFLEQLETHSVSWETTIQPKQHAPSQTPGQSQPRKAE